MKKLITVILVCFVAVACVVPAFAATATRIGTTSYYYTNDTGFGGGDRDNGTKTIVSLSTLSSYMTGAAKAATSYTFDMATLGNYSTVKVYRNSTYYGYLCTSSGSIYAALNESSGGSAVDNSDILQAILGTLRIGLNDGTNNWHGVAEFSSGIYSYVISIWEKLQDVSNKLNNFSSNFDTFTQNIYSALIYRDYSVGEYLYLIEHNTDLTNTKLNTIINKMDSNSDNDLNVILPAIVSPITDVGLNLDRLLDLYIENSTESVTENNITEVGDKLDQLIQLNIDNSVDYRSSLASPLNPFVRKIYNVLYGGVDGSGTDLVDIALDQMGETEGYTYYSWYGFDSHVEWCACFVSWCADQCDILGIAVPKFAVVDDGVTWFKSFDMWADGGSVPSAGDIIFFDWDGDHDPDHVGIVADCDGSTVTTVEGNTGGSPGVVSSRSISVDSPLIYGYGTPEYSSSSGDSIYSILLDISHKMGRSSSYDDSVLLSRLNDIDANISNISTIDITHSDDVIYGELLDMEWGTDEYLIYFEDDPDCLVPGLPIYLSVDLDDESIFPDDTLYLLVYDPSYNWMLDFDYYDFVDGVVKFYIPDDYDITQSPLLIWACVSYSEPENPLDYITVYTKPDDEHYTWFSWFYDWANDLDMSTYDDTVLVSKLTDIENALSNIGDGVTVTIDNVTDIDISPDNDNYNVFFVDGGEDGTEDDKSIVDLTKDSASVFGKLLNFLYKAMIKDSLSTGGGIDDLSDFYFDESAGVDVWGS